MHSANLDLTKVYSSNKIGDRAPSKSLRFYTVEALSENRELTPEGYLLCYDACLARVGTYTYKADEIPMVEPDDNGIVTVIRHPEDVFKEEAIASFVGKSVTNNHPSEGVDVTPDNWRALEVGVILDPRRGSGDKKDFLVADLLIKDKQAIELIQSGKTQLSCGYEAEYLTLKKGFAKQYGIIGNHVAIVENGRAGPKCSILDEDTLRLNNPSGNTKTGKNKMANGINTALSNLKDALNKTTALTVDNNSITDTGSILAVALDNLTKRLDKIEGKLSTRDRRRRDADDDRHRDAYNYTMRYKGAHSSDDDDDRRHRDDDDDRRGRDDDDDRRGRDDDDDRRRRDARRRDDDDDRRRDSRMRDDDDDRHRDSRRRDDDDDRRHRDDDDDDRRRRDARRRRDDDDDDAHFTDKHKRDEAKEVEAEAGEKNKDKARKAKDSTYLEDSYQETISLAECLLPGIQAPKFVRDASPVETTKNLCKFRKDVLQTVFTKPEGRQLILELNRGEAPDFTGMSCSAARSLFRDCAIVAKKFNNMKTADKSETSFGLLHINNPVVSSPSAYNEWAKSHWEDQYGYGKNPTNPNKIN